MRTEEQKRRAAEYERQRRADPVIREKQRQKAIAKYRSLPPGEGAKRQKEKRLADPDHKTKAKEYAKRYREGNDTQKRATRNWQLKTQYGVTLEQFEQMIKNQGGRCFICQTDDPGKKGFCMDHCHASLKYRKVLCRSCNLALGAAKDSPELLREMAAYLEHHRE